MIRKIPGWLNFFLLGLFYFMVLSLVHWVWGQLGTLTISQATALDSLVYAGGYLSKFRFDESSGGWELVRRESLKDDKRRI